MFGVMFYKEHDIRPSANETTCFADGPTYSTMGNYRSTMTLWILLIAMSCYDQFLVLLIVLWVTIDPL